MPSLDLPNRPTSDPAVNGTIPRPFAPKPKVAATGGSFSKMLVASVLGVAVVAGYFLWKYLRGDAGVDPSLFQTEKVEKRTLRIMVTESGNVESSSNLDLKCRVEGGSQILTIIPDGTHVTKGTKLVTLSSAAIDEKINAQQIVVERGQLTVYQTDQDAGVAEIAYKEYLEGSFNRDLQTAQSALVVQEQNVKTAENIFNHSETMFRKGHINQLQLDAQKDSVARAKLDLASAKTALSQLVDFTKPKTIKQLESARDVAKAKAVAEKRAFQLEKDKLARLEDQKSQCTIIAPQDGTVIYANQESFRGNSQVVIEEGAQVKEFQTILRLPDLSKMQVKAMIHETKVGRLRVGMPAMVRVRDQEAKGEVSQIMSQAENQNWFSAVKSYAAYVGIKDSKAFADLKPNMTAQVTILVKELKDVIAVPLQAVVEKGGKFYCYLRRESFGKGYEERPVVIGDNNDKHLEILDGLAVGDVVILNPRAMCAEAREAVPEPDSAAGLQVPPGVSPQVDGASAKMPGKAKGKKGQKGGGGGPPGGPPGGGPPGGSPGGGSFDPSKKGSGGDRQPQAGSQKVAPQKPAT